MIAKRYGVSFETDENVPKNTVAKVLLFSECTNNH